MPSAPPGAYLATEIPTMLPLSQTMDPELPQRYWHIRLNELRPAGIRSVELTIPRVTVVQAASFNGLPTRKDFCRYCRQSSLQKRW